jgi:hypothetical protein
VINEPQFFLLFQKVSDEKYDVVVDGSLIKVTTSKEPPITVLITLTSPVMRDEVEAAQGNKMSCQSFVLIYTESNSVTFPTIVKIINWFFRYMFLFLNLHRSTHILETV